MRGCAASESGDSSSSISTGTSGSRSIRSIKKRDPKQRAGDGVAWKFVDSRVISSIFGLSANI